MSQKVSYLIIGLLTGLLLREWVVRPAGSQTTTVRAQEFILVDANGKVTASLYNGSTGPILGIGRSGEPYVLISSRASGANLSVSSSSGEPYVLVGGSATTAIVSVSGGGNNKTLIGADATLSSVTSGGVAVENSLNRGHAVRLSTTTQGGRVVTYKNFSVTSRVPATASKLAASPTSTWGQIKAGEPAGDEPIVEPVVADDAEFESLLREERAQLEALNQR